MIVHQTPAPTASVSPAPMSHFIGGLVSKPGGATSCRVKGGSTFEPTEKAVLFFEKEVAGDLGIHGEEGVSPIAAIGRVCHRIPEQREKLMLRLADRT